MVKSYLRYTTHQTIGVISYPSSNVALDESGRLALCGSSCGRVAVWNIKQSMLLGYFMPETSTFVGPAGLANLEVTFIRSSCGPQNEGRLAVGYNDGSVRIFPLSTSILTDLSTATLEPLVFRGHKGPICQLLFTADAQRLVSASRNGEIVLWDVENAAGLARLKGHADAVTQLEFIDSAKLATLFPTVDYFPANLLFLISSSKDKLMKVWNLESYFCQQTLVEHVTEVGAFLIHTKEQMMITGAQDSLLRLYKFVQDDQFVFKLAYYGSMDRGSAMLDKITEMHWTGPDSPYFIIAGQEKTFSLFKYYDSAEMKKVEARRRKRRAAKPADADSMDLELSPLIKPGDELRCVSTVRSQHKIRSVSPVHLAKDLCSVLVSTFDNMLETYRLGYKDAGAIEAGVSVANNGHRHGITRVVMSHNNELLATISRDAIKIWNASSGDCFRTFLTGELGEDIPSVIPTNITFSQDDRAIVVTSKEGHIVLLDVQTGDSLQFVSHAHSANIWAMDSGVNDIYVTGASDKMIHFWELDHDQESSTYSLSLVRSMQMPDDVLGLKISPNNQYLAVALLDSTVKVFYLDSLKFYLSLYGHKLPVTCLDFSFDSRLIATGSSDKNVKIWGLDFGDCHKSIFAHTEAVTAICFIPKTHYFFTAGKDKLIKYYDGDKFVQITKLTGHLSDVTSLAISKNGGFLLSSSNDKSVKIWERTDEQIFLEEEREKEADESLDASLMSRMDELAVDAGDAVEDLPTRDSRSLSSMHHSEKLYEILELVAEHKATQKEYSEALTRSSTAVIGEAPPKSSLLQAYELTYKSKWSPKASKSEEWLVLQVFKAIPSAEIEQTLILLPLNSVIQLLDVVLVWFQNSWMTVAACRLVVIILRLHGALLTQYPTFKSLLAAIRDKGLLDLKAHRDLVGRNICRAKLLLEDIASMSIEIPDVDAPEKRKADHPKD